VPSILLSQYKDESMSQQQHEGPGADDTPGQQQPTPQQGAGGSGTGSDSVMRQLREWEQRRAGDYGDGKGNPG
jgi:hypothetical protein